MNNNNIFHKIINQEIPAYKVAENSDHLALLDINPIIIGHTLVISKKSNRDNFFSLSEIEFISIMSFTRKVAVGIGKIIPCNRVGIFVMGFEIPHVHVHLIPMDQESDGNFFKRRMILSEFFFQILSEKLKNLLK